MPSASQAIDVICKQVLKGEYKESEAIALNKARAKIFNYSLVGGLIGLGGSFYFVRRKSVFAKLVVCGLSTAFFYRSGGMSGLVSSVKDFSQNREYPNIQKALRTIREEIIKSRGNSGYGSMLPRSKPDFENLPPSSNSIEKNSNNEFDDSNSQLYSFSEDNNRFSTEIIKDPWDQKTSESTWK
ncbi:hypothetical protein BB561_003945 [Smittium simulii]|uniref:Uncharacterized protein n=1 Tax=Smittium simulii TaxID=133385 RepID=A0A2T9YIS0_9FUNG|nr:hypothetical protein BB561_003945 [Smittium simulii]